MKIKYPYLSVLILIFFSLTLNIYCQNWDELNDSSYYSILQKRFDKKNVLIGVGGSFKIDYGDYKIVGIGFRPQFGYFIAKQWLLLGNVDMYYSYAIQDTGIEISNYFKGLVGPSLRYYLKPKPRAIFGQLSAFAGKEVQNSKDISEFENINRPVLGGTLAVGLSAFIRKFELELLAGIKISSTSSEYTPEFIMQFNISYIFDCN